MKKWSKPTNPQLWEKLKVILWVCLILSYAAQLYSAYTEYNSIYQSTLSIPRTLLMIVLIEAGVRVFVTGSMENLFDCIRRFNLPDFFLFVLCSGLAGVLLVLSLGESEQGKTNSVNREMSILQPISKTVDSTTFLIEMKRINNVFLSDSLNAVSKNDSLFTAKKDQLNNIVQASKKRVESLKNNGDYSEESEYYSTRINSAVSKRRSANKSLRKLSNSKKDALKTVLDKNRSKRDKSISIAYAALLTNHNTIDSTNKATTLLFNQKIEKKQNRLSIAVFISVFFVLVYRFFYELARYLSGRKPIIQPNEIEFKDSNWKKVVEALKVHWYHIEVLLTSWIYKGVNFEGKEIKPKSKDYTNEDSILDSMFIKNGESERIKAENEVLRQQLLLLKKQKEDADKVTLNIGDTTTLSVGKESPKLSDNEKQREVRVIERNTVTEKTHLFNYTKHTDKCKTYFQRSMTSKKEATKAANFKRCCAESLILAYHGIAVMFDESEIFIVAEQEGRGRPIFEQLRTETKERIKREYDNSPFIESYLDKENLSYVIPDNFRQKLKTVSV